MAALLGRFRLDKGGIHLPSVESTTSQCSGEAGAPGPSASFWGLACICALSFHLVTLAQRFQALQKGLPGLRHALFQEPALTFTLRVFGVGHTFQCRVQVAQPNCDGHLVWERRIRDLGEVAESGGCWETMGATGLSSEVGSGESGLVRACPPAWPWLSGYLPPSSLISHPIHLSSHHAPQPFRSHMHPSLLFPSLYHSLFSLPRALFFFTFTC